MEWHTCVSSIPPSDCPWSGGVLTVNVLRLVLGDLANLQFTVGGLGGAITAGQVVDDDTQDVVARDVGKSRLKPRDVLDGVAEGK